MPIEARDLQTWIGTEVLDSSGEKLGKLEDVHFRDSEPLAVSVRSGLGGRKHHAAALRGATVSRDGLQLDATAETMVTTHGAGLGVEELTKLAAHDDRLHGIQPEELEGWTPRRTAQGPSRGAGPGRQARRGSTPARQGGGRRQGTSPRRRPRGRRGAPCARAGRSASAAGAQRHRSTGLTPRSRRRAVRGATAPVHVDLALIHRCRRLVPSGPG